MSHFLKKAYEVGYNYGAITKAAAISDGPYGRHLTSADINKLILGTVGGGLTGSFIGGPYHRGSGAATGALMGAIISNPQLFAALVSDAGAKMYNFAGGRPSLIRKGK